MILHFSFNTNPCQAMQFNNQTLFLVEMSSNNKKIKNKMRMMKVKVMTKSKHQKVPIKTFILQIKIEMDIVNLLLMSNQKLRKIIIKSLKLKHTNMQQAKNKFVGKILTNYFTKKIVNMLE